MSYLYYMNVFIYLYATMHHHSDMDSIVSLFLWADPTIYRLKYKIVLWFVTK